MTDVDQELLALEPRPRSDPVEPRRVPAQVARVPDDFTQPLRVRLRERVAISRQRRVDACRGLDERREGAVLVLAYRRSIPTFLWLLVILFIGLSIGVAVNLAHSAPHLFHDESWVQVLAVAGTVLGCALFGAMTVALLALLGSGGSYELVVTANTIDITTHAWFRAQVRRIMIDDVRAPASRTMFGRVPTSPRVSG